MVVFFDFSFQKMSILNKMNIDKWAYWRSILNQKSWLVSAWKGDEKILPGNDLPYFLFRWAGTLKLQHATTLILIQFKRCRTWQQVEQRTLYSLSDNWHLKWTWKPLGTLVFSQYTNARLQKSHYSENNKNSSQTLRNLIIILWNIYIKYINQTSTNKILIRLMTILPETSGNFCCRVPTFVDGLECPTLLVVSKHAPFPPTAPLVERRLRQLPFPRGVFESVICSYNAGKSTAVT